jgi:hypothetical protein
VDAARGEVDHEQRVVRDLRELSPAVLASVASLKTLKTNVVSGDGQQETTREVKLWDKLRELELLAKHFGLVTDRHNVNLHADESLFAKLDQFKARNRNRHRNGGRMAEGSSDWG